MRTISQWSLAEVKHLRNQVHELVLEDGGTRNGFRYAYWYLLPKETRQLAADDAVRSDYSHGVWVVGKDVAGYGFSNAPVRDDVSWGKWQMLTTGADATASPAVQASIEGMAAWAKR